MVKVIGWKVCSCSASTLFSRLRFISSRPSKFGALRVISSPFPGGPGWTWTGISGPLFCRVHRGTSLASKKFRTRNGFKILSSRRPKMKRSISRWTMSLATAGVLALPVTSLAKPQEQAAPQQQPQPAQPQPAQPQPEQPQPTQPQPAQPRPEPPQPQPAQPQP